MIKRRFALQRCGDKALRLGGIRPRARISSHESRHGDRPRRGELGFGVVRVEGRPDGRPRRGRGRDAPPSCRLKRRLASGSTQALAELIDLARAEGAGDRGRLLRQERALGDGRRPGQRGRDAGRRPARHPCFDYTPQAIKMAVCGSGAAGKKQVQRMVGDAARACPSRPSSDHAADALAVAICHGGGSRRAAQATRWRPSGAQRVGRMIAAVRGEVMVRRPDHVVIDAGGVGYRLAVSAETLKAVPGRGQRGLPARRAGRPRRLAGPLRLRIRGGARPLPAS